jgi:hypothetical protein
MPTDKLTYPPYPIENLSLSFINLGCFDKSLGIFLPSHQNTLYSRKLQQAAVPWLFPWSVCASVYGFRWCFTKRSLGLERTIERIKCLSKPWMNSECF